MVDDVEKGKKQGAALLPSPSSGCFGPLLRGAKLDIVWSTPSIWIFLSLTASRMEEILEQGSETAFHLFLIVPFFPAYEPIIESRAVIESCREAET